MMQVKASTRYNIMKTLQKKDKEVKTEKDKLEVEKEATQPSLQDSKQVTLKYILVGIMIKVFVVENGVKKQCIKSIPVEKAPPEIIAQIENLTFLDMMMINDLKNEEQS